MYDVILADPPWRYTFSRSKTRRVENQYPTMTLEEILAYPAPANKNAVLYLWATAPKLPEALAVMAAWGFTYKSCAVWDKVQIGMGYWFRGRHELLLVGTRGRFSPPGPGLRIPSIFTEPRGRHSAKPDFVHRLIEAAYPEASKVELFARQERPGWAAVGNELITHE